MRYIQTLLLILFCMTFIDANAQSRRKKNKSVTKDKTEDYFNESEIRYDNHVYMNNIKTVNLYIKDSPISGNVIGLNQQVKLQLGFDDLDSDLKDYNYSFFHCNSKWEPTDLLESDFLSNFYNNAIENFDYSFNTLQPFTHYEVEFPSNDIKFTKSGNYIVLVYLDNDIEQPVLAKRFMITEQGVNIVPNIKPASIIDDRNYRQEVDFTLRQGSYPIQNPYSNVNIVIQQNGRMDNLVTDLKPVFVKENEIVYDFDEVNVFDGCNEYRFFDFKSFYYQTVSIAKYAKNDTTNFVYLLKDEAKSYKNHYSVQELNGKYMIDFENGNDPDIEADYAHVLFTLKQDRAIANGDLYVFGEFSDWKFKDECKLTYIEELGVYQTSVYLKQGYYNYHYALLKDNEKKADVSFIEGTHYATENDYTIYVYYKDPIERYERLIGVQKVNTHQ